jgi:hypothetical protein
MALKVVDESGLLFGTGSREFDRHVETRQLQDADLQGRQRTAADVDAALALLQMPTAVGRLLHQPARQQRLQLALNSGSARVMANCGTSAPEA